MSDFTQWVADNGLVAVRRFGDGNMGGVVPMTYGKYRLILGPEMQGYHERAY